MPKLARAKAAPCKAFGHTAGRDTQGHCVVCQRGANKRYWKSKKGRATLRRYAMSEKGRTNSRERNRRYRSTFLGLLNSMKGHARERHLRYLILTGEHFQ